MLGYIVRTHGTKGELTIHLDVDYPEEYEEMDSVFVEIKGELVPYFVERINLQKQSKAIVQFEDINTIEKAQALVGTALYMPLDTLEALEEGQFYYHEIQGYRVVDQQLGELGTVKDVYAQNAQDLIAMEYQGVEVLIPTVNEIVLRADRLNRQLLVNLPEGLLEVYLDPNAEAEPEEDDAD
ncbi:16S rRNA processing protein RimM [Rhabdobacter roseus]|uniref:Ribosome maturation factor RimM n=1 Tax=Rhabdobacter roseus TaxID=1655419 RepID=A0A840TVH2_9BACT|nr:16S rRNA processing protein RimM [Rhabdobacter roseus]